MISVFQRHKYCVFFPQTNLEKTDDISKTSNRQIKTIHDIFRKRIATWTWTGQGDWELELGRLHLQPRAHRDLSGAWWHNFQYAARISKAMFLLCGICSGKPIGKSKAAMLITCTVQCLYYLIHIHSYDRTVNWNISRPVCFPLSLKDNTVMQLEWL